MSTCNRLDLQTLGSYLVMPKNLPNHWLRSRGVWLDPTLNTSPKPYLVKCRHAGIHCHIWDLGLGVPCEVVSLDFHGINGWDCTD